MATLFLIFTITIYNKHCANLLAGLKLPLAPVSARPGLPPLPHFYVDVTDPS